MNHRKDKTFENFMKRWEEVTEIPPQNLGPLTKAYKQATRRLKIMPWPWFVAVSVAMVFGLYLSFGSNLAHLVSLLQKSF